MDLFFEAHYGFGDNLYERPFVIAMAKHFNRVFVQTHFPEIYHDQPRHKFFFVRPPNVDLKLQTENAISFKNYREAPADDAFRFSFRNCKIKGSGLSRIDAYSMFAATHFGWLDIDMHFPLKPEWRESASSFLKKCNIGCDEFCLFRPPSVQKGFRFANRFAPAEYYKKLLDLSRKEAVVIGVANCHPEYEIMPVDDFEFDIDLTQGQISIWSILALLQGSSFNVGAPGFFIPSSIVLEAKTFILSGESDKEDLVWQIPSWMPETLGIGFVKHSSIHPSMELLEQQFTSWIKLKSILV